LAFALALGRGLGFGFGFGFGLWAVPPSQVAQLAWHAVHTLAAPG